MHVGMDIDSGRVWVDNSERRRRGGDGDGKRPARDFLGSAGFLGLLGFLGSSLGTTMDVSACGWVC